MKEGIRAVITGDIVGSTRIVGDYREVLHQIGSEIQEFQDDRFIIDIYRGDSFQTISNRPEKSFLILLIIKAGIKRYSTKQGNQETQWDARMSLGIGPLKEYPTSKELRELSGDPFTKSGRSLDQMKEKGKLIKITTGDEYIDDELDATCPLIDVIINRWNTTQAEAVYYYLLRNFTQRELGEMFEITQRGAGKRLESSNIDTILGYEGRFQNLITQKWKM